MVAVREIVSPALEAVMVSLFWLKVEVTLDGAGGFVPSSSCWRSVLMWL
jgi:hypothetical protein